MPDHKNRSYTKTFQDIVDSQDKDKIQRMIAELQTYQEELSVQQEELHQQQNELAHVHHELEQSRQKYLDLYELAPVAYFTFDPRGLLLETNRAGAELLGTDPHLYIRKPILGFIEKDCITQFLLHLSGIVNTDRLKTCELTLKRKNGTHTHVQVESKAVKDASGGTLIFSAFTDITERKDAEDALRASREQLRQRIEEVETLMDVAPVAIWVSRDSQCTEIIGNRAANNFFEASEQENISANTSAVRRFFHDGRELKPEELPMQAAVASNCDILNAEFDALLPSGKRLSLIGSASPLRNAKGDARGCIGAFLEITERRQMEQERGQWITQLAREKQALAESEQRYRIMGEILPYGIWLCDAKGKAVYTSQSFLGLLDMSMEKMQGFGWATRLVPEDVEPMMKKWMHCVRTGEDWDYEHRIIDRTGQIHTVLTRGRPVRDQSGNITAWAGINLDITERKQAEEALRSERQRIENILSCISDSYITWDHQWRYTYVNEATLRSTGRTREQLLGHSFWEVYPDALGTEFERNARYAMEKRVPAKFEYHYPSNNRWWENRFYPAPDGGLAAFSSEITERKRAEEALRESEERFRTMADGLPLIVWVHDDKGEQKFVNQTFLEFFGVTSDEMKGSRWQMLMHPDDAEAYTNEFIACVSDRRPFRAQVRVRRADGKWRWIESWGRPRLTPSDEFLGFIGASADVTDSKRIKDELLRLNETLEQQVNERTKLAEARSKQLVKLAVELIEAEELERKKFAQFLHDDLQQMLASAKMQLQIISKSSADEDTLAAVNHILEESIGKSRNWSHELSPAILHRSGLEAALRWLSDKMNAQFGLKVEFLATMKQIIKSSTIAIFMFRSAQELLFNIVKHADVKNAYLVLSSSDDSISLTVSDQGKGFDPEAVDLLTGNVGFGIMTIRERASHIGGRLTIDSASGKGSRFTLQVPLRLSLTPDVQNVVPEAQRRTPTERAISTAATGIRVLFADDHKVMRQGLIRLISSQPGIAVAGEAANGREAVELARQLHPDVILMDISMPEMDGIEATRCIKAELPEVHVIGLSMYEDINSAQNIINAGADSFVPKTASSAELLKAIYESCD